MTGKNQSYARQLNNQLIIRYLRNDVGSATDLAQKLSLSNAAMTSIMGNLLRGGYIKEVTLPRDKGALGRIPVYYTINENFGEVAVVHLSNHTAKIVIANMKQQITDSLTYTFDKYDLETLYQLMLLLKDMLYTEKHRGISLLGIELSVPGRVNSRTGKLQLSPQFCGDIFCQTDGIIEMFQRHFGTPVGMTNDINLAALGELAFGKLQNVTNGLLVHLDEGIGGAIVLDGKLRSGQSGYAGEIGLLRTYFQNRWDCLDEFVSLRVIKQQAKAFSTCDVAQAVAQDANLKNYVLSTAECLGAVLKDVVELLDISTVVLSGRVPELCDNYVQAVNDAIGLSDRTTVVLSEMGTDASVYGAITKLVEGITDKLFN